MSGCWRRNRENKISHGRTLLIFTILRDLESSSLKETLDNKLNFCRTTGKELWPWSIGWENFLVIDQISMKPSKHNSIQISFEKSPAGRSFSNSSTRVYVVKELSYERGGMCNLAYIGTTVLNFGLTRPADVYAS